MTTALLDVDVDLAMDLASRTAWSVGQWAPVISAAGGAARARRLLAGSGEQDFDLTPRLLQLLAAIDAATVEEPVPP